MVFYIIDSDFSCIFRDLNKKAKVFDNSLVSLYIKNRQTKNIEPSSPAHEQK